MSVEKVFKIKQEAAKKRNIDWDFSEEQFKYFYSLRNEVKCFYTDTNFVFDNKSDYYPTMERIDDKGSYSVDNCVWVTSIANYVKDKYIDKLTPLPKNDPVLAGLKHRIVKLLNTTTLFKERQEVYLDFKKTRKQENIELAEKARKEQEEKNILEKRLQGEKQKIQLALQYASFGEQVIDCGAVFELTHSEYNRKLLRKTCEITGKILPEDLSERTLWVSDKKLPVCKDNVYATSVCVQQSLDRMGLSKEQLMKLFK